MSQLSEAEGEKILEFHVSQEEIHKLYANSFLSGKYKVDQIDQERKESA